MCTSVIFQSSLLVPCTHEWMHGHECQDSTQPCWPIFPVATRSIAMKTPSVDQNFPRCYSFFVFLFYFWKTYNSVVTFNPVKNLANFNVLFWLEWPAQCKWFCVEGPCTEPNSQHSAHLFLSESPLMSIFSGPHYTEASLGAHAPKTSNFHSPCLLVCKPQC